MQNLRRVVFWCHLLAGVVAGAVVLIMSVTGVLLMYERQIVAWADTRGYEAAPPSAAAPRLGPDALVAALAASEPSLRVTSLTLRSGSGTFASAAVGQRTIYLNPYTGAVLGEGSTRVRAFFRSVTDWHRWLAVSGEGRATARMVTGASNLAFLFLVASGFYLWFPRNLTWRQIRAVLWFRGGLPGKARDFNWHNVIGFWSAVPLFVVVLSGVVISSPWASDLVYRAAGEQPPARVAPTGAGAGRRAQASGTERTAQDAAVVPPQTFDALWARASSQVEGWTIITMRVPAPGAPVVFTIDRGDGGQPQKRGTLTLDGATGDVVRWEPFERLTPGRRLRSYLRFAHTGEVLGLVGQTIAGLVSLGGAVLVYTGLALALRRFWAWRGRRARVPAAVSPGAVVAER